jgi:hypothetical protein
VIALEELVAEEAHCIETREIATVLGIQTRLDPIIRYLSDHAADADHGVRDRIAAVLRIRERSSATLEAELQQTRKQIDELDARKRRAAAVAPVYGGGAVQQRGRLNAKG